MAQHRPTIMDMAVFESQTHKGDAIEGQNGNKQMSLNPMRLMMPNRPQPQFRLERAEIRFDFHQSPRGLDDVIKIPVRMAGSKDVRPQAKITGLGRVVIAPRYIRRLLLGVLRHLDGVVMPHKRGAFASSTDLLQNLVVGLHTVLL